MLAMASTVLPGLANIPRARPRYDRYHLPSTIRAASSSFFCIRRHFSETVDSGFRLGVVVKPLRAQDTNRSFATAGDGNTPTTATEDPDPIVPPPVDHSIPNVLPSHRFNKPATTIAGASPGPGLERDENKQDRKTSKKTSLDTKSDDYSSNMTHAMGAVLTYRHKLGMNYNFVLPDLIVGSCLQTPSDVDRLKKVGVKTVFCLQQDPDLEYFGVDVHAIQARAKEIGGIEHIRAEIRDFDPFDLRKRLPSVVATLYRAVQRNKGITYIHCTAGLGRAPAVALAYMHWLLGYDLLDANEMLLSVRPCFPKLEAIRNATCDLLTGDAKELIQLKWPDNDCQSVEISGLDVGWGQMVPLTFVPKRKHWILNRELLVGKYEYKYVVDGLWTTNPHEPLTQPNKDGHINNFVEVLGESEDANAKSLRKRLMQENPELNDIDRKIIRRKLLSLPSE